MFAGNCRVELVILAQTSASLFADDYDDAVTQRMQAGAGVPAMTSAQALGRAVRALGVKRVAVVSPYSEEVSRRAAAYFTSKHGVEIVAVESFAATMPTGLGSSNLSLRARHSLDWISR